jgi:2-keto-4-pentenoate hydratase/2-oxohepta-3-ene-1,7-dioic acid hydratase in catechol pathway
VKLCYFDDFKPGVVKQDTVVDISPVIADIPHVAAHDWINGLIENFANYRSKISDFVATQPGKPVSAVQLRAPLLRPANFVCMAVNYMENGTRSEPAPINAFTKAAGCIIGPGDTMVLPDVPAVVFEGEAELAVVIGKRARNVSAARAMEHVFGYLNFIDGSARGLQPFWQMKSRETFAPIGPYLVTADEVADPQNIAIRLWVNGQLMQDFNTSDMAHSIARCIEWVSSAHTLEPGDILATGTNHLGLNPFHDGDTVELECQGMGRLRIGVQDDLKRTWERGTRLERQQKGLKPAHSPQLTGKYAT